MDCPGILNVGTEDKAKFQKLVDFGLLVQRMQSHAGVERINWLEHQILANQMRTECDGPGNTQDFRSVHVERPAEDHAIVYVYAIHTEVSGDPFRWEAGSQTRSRQPLNPERDLKTRSNCLYGSSELVEPKHEKHEVTVEFASDSVPGQAFCLWPFFQKRLNAGPLKPQDQIKSLRLCEDLSDIHSEFGMHYYVTEIAAEHSPPATRNASPERKKLPALQDQLHFIQKRLPASDHVRSDSHTQWVAGLLWIRNPLMVIVSFSLN